MEAFINIDVVEERGRTRSQSASRLPVEAPAVSASCQPVVAVERLVVAGAASRAGSGSCTPRGGRTGSPTHGGSRDAGSSCTEVGNKRPYGRGSSSDGGDGSPGARPAKRNTRVIADSSSESDEWVPETSRVVSGKTPGEMRLAAKGKCSRPPTAGELCSRAEARAQLVEIKRQEMDLRVEEEVASRLLNATRSFPKRGEGTIAGVPTVELASSADEAVSAVEQVATKSKNLKGGYVKHLKMASQVVRATVDELVHRVYAANAEKEDPTSTSSEMERILKKMESLEEENKMLREVIEALKKTPPPVQANPVESVPPPKEKRSRNQAAPKRYVETGMTMECEGGFPPLPLSYAERMEGSPPPPPIPAPRLGSVPSRYEPPSGGDDLIARLGEMIEAKLAKFRREISEEMDRRITPSTRKGKRGDDRGEDMLLPPEPLRKPQPRAESIGGRGRGHTKVPPTPTTAPSRSGKQKPMGRSESIGGGSRGGQKVLPSPAPAPSGAVIRSVETIAPPARAAVEDGEWSEVVRRGRRKKAAPVTEPANAAAPKRTTKKPPPPQKGEKARNTPPQKAGSKGNAPPKKRKAPRTAAVTLQCPEGESVAILTEARAKVDFAAVGTPDGLKVRRTQTGATSWEVAGEGRAEKADALAAELRRVFAGREGVTISRPVKTAELRLSNLDDSATGNDVAAAIAKMGGCSLENIKAGIPRPGPNRLNAVWLRCPVEVANRAAAAGHLTVGWTRVKVTLLEARKLQCFKCLEQGHVRANCVNETDRGELCYRCGSPGHSARECRGVVRCPVCADAGRPAGHKVGSRACPPPKKGKKKKGGIRLPTADLPVKQRGEASSNPSTERSARQGGEIRPAVTETNPEPMEVVEGTSASRADKRKRTEGEESDGSSQPPERLRGGTAVEAFGDEYY